MRPAFWRKAPEPETITPEQRLFEAVDEVTAAWNAMPNNKLRPWIDWDGHRVIVTEYTPELAHIQVHP